MKRVICVLISLMTMALFAGSGHAAGTTFLVFGGAVSGSSGMQTASIISGHVNAKSGGSINLTAGASGGSVENVNRLNAGEIDFGIVFANDAYEAFTGTGLFEGKKLQNLRTLGNIYMNYVHFNVAASSGISTMAGLTGKKVGLGAQGTGSSMISDRMFTFLNMMDKIKPTYIGMLDALTAITDGQLDAAVNAPTIPWSGFLNFASTTKPGFIMDMNDVLRKAGFFEKYPFLIDTAIPAGTYSGFDKDIPTIGVYTTWGVGAHVPDEAVYNIMKLCYDKANVQTLAATMRALGELGNEAKVLQVDIPLHPGAVKYWTERGMKLPTTLKPD